MKLCNDKLLDNAKEILLKSFHRYRVMKRETIEGRGSKKKNENGSDFINL